MSNDISANFMKQSQIAASIQNTLNQTVSGLGTLLVFFFPTAIIFSIFTQFKQHQQQKKLTVDNVLSYSTKLRE